MRFIFQDDTYDRYEGFSYIELWRGGTMDSSTEYLTNNQYKLKCLLKRKISK